VYGYGCSDKFVLNPGFCEPRQLDFIHFMGNLFGLAITSKQYLNLNLVRACVHGESLVGVLHD